MTVVEKRPILGSDYPGLDMFSARNRGSGVPDPGKFGKRPAHYRVPEHDRSSRNRSDRVSRYGSDSATTGLPNWYHYGVITAFFIIAIIAAIALT